MFIVQQPLFTCGMADVNPRWKFLPHLGTLSTAELKGPLLSKEGGRVGQALHSAWEN